MTQSDSNRIRVVIVDDHNMVRKGLVVLLHEFDDIEVVAEASDGEVAISTCVRYGPDVVLMDIIMPHINGIVATEKIRELCPNTQIVALTSFSEEDQIHAALQAGAIGYIMKDVSGNELADAIRRAHVGESTLSPQAAQVLIRATTRPPALGHDLTDREREILALMIEGLNNRMIGERLIISNSTVKNHVSSILSKMGTSSRTQAVALAVEHRILD